MFMLVILYLQFKSNETFSGSILFYLVLSLKNGLDLLAHILLRSSGLAAPGYPVTLKNMHTCIILQSGYLFTGHITQYRSVQVIEHCTGHITQYRS